MHALLQPGAESAGHPPLPWSARQLREQRRRDMLLLQRWLEVETGRLDTTLPAGDAHGGGAVPPEALTTTAAKGRALYDQAVQELARHVGGGGSEEASELLAQVWLGYKGLEERVHEGMRREVEAARRRADSAEAQAEAVRQELQRRQLLSTAAVPSGSPSCDDDVAGESTAAVAPAQRDRGGVRGDAAVASQAAAEASEQAGESLAAATQLQHENARLRAAVAAAARELSHARQRAVALEAAADELADTEARAERAEARAERAEAERDAVLDRQDQLTPRPAQAHVELRAAAGEGGLDAALAALAAHPDAEPAELAALLAGSSPGASPPLPPSVPPPVPSAGGPDVGARPLEASPFRGALRGAPLLPLAAALGHSRGPTAVRYAALEEEAGALRAQCAALSSELELHREAERRREAARRRHEEEAQVERKNALQQYLDLLAGQGEDGWKEFLIGMGQGGDVPKLFRHSGKVRNKHMSKRDTEKLVKELWKERLADPAVAGGRAAPLVDFVDTHLHKKVGITAAVLELGYNFLYGLWRFQWDADCDLFLKVLTGEASEELYLAQARLQSDLEEMFAALDKAKGQITGLLPKDDLRTAMATFFKVGQPGGKTAERFDAAMQALEQEHAGEVVEWAKLFEEDREFNQGEFAEALRDQFLEERIEFFAALEVALYEESGNEEECAKGQVAQAILAVDPDTTEKAAAAAAAGCFGPGVDSLSIKVVVKKLARGLTKGARVAERGSGSSPGARASTSAKMSVVGTKGRGSAPVSGPGKSVLPGTAKLQNENIGKALEAVRLTWISRQVAQQH